MRGLILGLAALVVTASHLRRQQADITAGRTVMEKCHALATA